jgi:hypothetical protein
VIYSSPALVKIHFVKDVILCVAYTVPVVLKDYRAFYSWLLGVEWKVLSFFRISDITHLLTLSHPIRMEIFSNASLRNSNLAAQYFSLSQAR